MRNIKIIIEYDGSRYQGWQRLKNTDNTIQGKIEGVISHMVGEVTEIIGSGRTDGGVHARGQVANFKTNSNLTPEEMQQYMNRYLPQDIVVKKVEVVDDRFHSRYWVENKEYTYRIWNAPIPSAFERKYTYHIPKRLNIENMKKASEKLVGTHDFLAFSSLKKSKKSTIRTVESISFYQKGPLIEITFTAEGFLYNMVRIMVGTLIEIGLGKMKVEEIDAIFAKGLREAAGETAPAQGLFLMKVNHKSSM